MRNAAPRQTLAIDFDGTIRVNIGWNGGALTAADRLTPGAWDAIRQLSTRYRIVVFTARYDLCAVRRWLNSQGLGAMIADVTNKKPEAVAYIDDRGFHFTDWQSVLRAF